MHSGICFTNFVLLFRLFFFYILYLHRLLVGILLSLCTLYVKGIKPYYCLLGFIPETMNIYVDINQHRYAMEVPKTKIFRYTGSLNFATANLFRKALRSALYEENAPKIIKMSYDGISSQSNKSEQTLTNGTVNRSTAFLFSYLILDLSMLAHVDMAGCQALSDVLKEYKDKGVEAVLLAGTSDQVYDSLVHSMALGCGPFVIFPSVHDAVEYANACRTS